MAVPLSVGDVIHGFAKGVFGRSHHECVQIEAAGTDWIVARDSSGDPWFASGRRDLTLLISVRDEAPCPDGGSCAITTAEPLLTKVGGF